MSHDGWQCDGVKQDLADSGIRREDVVWMDLGSDDDDDDDEDDARILLRVVRWYWFMWNGHVSKRR